MILTILEANLEPGRESDLQAAYAAASGTLPAGLIHSELLRDARDATCWRIQTWWQDRQALEAMRATGTPGGVLMFRSAGAEPRLSIFQVVDELHPVSG